MSSIQVNRLLYNMLRVRVFRLSLHNGSCPFSSSKWHLRGKWGRKRWEQDQQSTPNLQAVLLKMQIKPGWIIVAQKHAEESRCSQIIPCKSWLKFLTIITTWNTRHQEWNIGVRHPISFTFQSQSRCFQQFLLVRFWTKKNKQLGKNCSILLLLLAQCT